MVQSELTFWCCKGFFSYFNFLMTMLWKMLMAYLVRKMYLVLLKNMSLWPQIMGNKITILFTKYKLPVPSTATWKMRCLGLQRLMVVYIYWLKLILFLLTYSKVGGLLLTLHNKLLTTQCAAVFLLPLKKFLFDLIRKERRKVGLRLNIKLFMGWT